MPEIGSKTLNAAGISSKEIDALYISNAFSAKANNKSLLNSIAFEELGINNSVCISSGDASGAVAIREAANSIMSGKSKIAMVIGVEKVSDVKSNDMALLSSDMIGSSEYFSGATVQSQFAIITRKYFNDFGIGAKNLFFLTAAKHRNAASNEFAQYNFEIDEEKIGSSQIAADPIRMLECASYCDGAAAIVMCNEGNEKRFKGKIQGYFLGGSVANDQLELAKRGSITTMEATVKAAKEAYKITRLNAGNIDLMEIYDFVPIAEVIAVEDMGFAKKGRGIKFVKENTKKINLSGGLKACGHALGATGVRQAVDVIKNLEGKKARYGLAQALAGTGSVSAINIFGNKNA